MDLNVLQSALLQLVYDALRSGPGVGEHQCGIVGIDQFLQGVVHHRVDDIRRQCGEVPGGAYDLEIQSLLGSRFY